MKFSSPQSSTNCLETAESGDPHIFIHTSLENMQFVSIFSAVCICPEGKRCEWQGRVSSGGCCWEENRTQTTLQSISAYRSHNQRHCHTPDMFDTTVNGISRHSQCSLKDLVGWKCTLVHQQLRIYRYTILIRCSNKGKYMRTLIHKHHNHTSRQFDLESDIRPSDTCR